MKENPCLILSCALLVFVASGGTVRGDLLGFWPANEGAGDTVANASSDSGLDGTLNSGAWSGNSGGHTGKPGDYAFELEGSQNSSVDVALLDVDFEEITITAWLKGSPTGDWTGLVQARDGAMPIGIGFRGNSGQLIYTWNDNSGEAYNFVSDLVIPADEWSFVALSLKPEATTLYLGTTGPDGELIEAVNEIDHFVQTNGGTPWFFGRDNCCGTERNFQGLMDDISIWDEALSQEDIARLYEMTASPLTLRGGVEVSRIELRSLLIYAPLNIGNLVLASAPASSVVGSLVGFTEAGDVALDLELPAGSVDYQLIVGEGDTHNALFQIGGDDGIELLTSGDLSGLAGQVLSIRVRGEDESGGELETTLNIFVGADSDGDQLLDDWEETLAPGDFAVLSGDSDNDGDGLNDGAEVNGDPATDPTKADTDGDGHSDPKELADGTHPLDPNDPGVELVGYWPADEGSGDTVANAGSNAELDGIATILSGPRVTPVLPVTSRWTWTERTPATSRSRRRELSSSRSRSRRGSTVSAPATGPRSCKRATLSSPWASASGEPLMNCSTTGTTTTPTPTTSRAGSAFPKMSGRLSRSP
jgi:hypothetical protein